MTPCPRAGPSCAICSRSLAVPKSVRIGIGPVCRARIAAGADATMETCTPEVASARFVGRDRADTILSRMRAWISAVAEVETLPDQTAVIMLIRRMEKAIQVGNEPKETVSIGAWYLASWLTHHVEPWCWMRHRNMVDDLARMYQHIRNLLEVSGYVHEAQAIQEMERRPRRGASYRKQIYRRIQWYPVPGT